MYVWMYVCLSLSVSVCLSVTVTVSVSGSISVSVSVCLCLYLSVFCLSLSLSLSFSLSLSLCFYIYIYLFICIDVNRFSSIISYCLQTTSTSSSESLWTSEIQAFVLHHSHFIAAFVHIEITLKTMALLFVTRGYQHDQTAWHICLHCRNTWIRRVSAAVQHCALLHIMLLLHDNCKRMMLQ